jgi:hypothetical protein
MLMPKQYSEILTSKGRDLKHLGIKEVALLRSDALDAIKSLEGHQIAVLGGDVYRDENGRLSPTYHNWFCEQRADENPMEFTKRSQQIALDSVQKYKTSEENKTLYTLTVSELGTIGLTGGA